MQELSRILEAKDRENQDMQRNFKDNLQPLQA